MSELCPDCQERPIGALGRCKRCYNYFEHNGVPRPREGVSRGGHNRVPVRSIDAGGETATYGSVKEAAEVTGLDAAEISRCSRGGRGPVGGLNWEKITP